MGNTRHLSFTRLMDILILIALAFAAYSTYKANDAQNRTHDLAREAAIQSHLNCVTLKQGRVQLNAHNKNILLFIHDTVPKDQLHDPGTIAYFKLAQKLFGQQLPPPKCV